MKRMIEIVYAKRTGHVLGAVTRAGKALPSGAAPKSPPLLFRHLDGATARVFPVDPAALAVSILSTELTPVEARALFAREEYRVIDGRLTAGAMDAGSVFSGAGDPVRVAFTLPSPATENLPWVLLGEPDAGITPQPIVGEIPPGATTLTASETFPPSAAPRKVLVLLAGYKPHLLP